MEGLLERILDIGFLAVVLASFPAVVWFFVFRRRMIRRIAQVARELEEALRPRDARYWYLGYLVGFRARYWVNRGPLAAASALYSIPPYHVFFYLPVIILARRREVLGLTLESRRPFRAGGEAHLVLEKSRIARATLSRDSVSVGRMRREELGGGYALYYTGDGALAGEARELASRLTRLGRVLRVSVDAGRRAVHATIALEPGASPGEVARELEAALRGVAGGPEAPR